MGHFYFKAAEWFFGLSFAGYVAVIQALLLLNIWLLWLLARRLGARPAAAVAGYLFFGLHMAAAAWT